MASSVLGNKAATLAPLYFFRMTGRHMLTFAGCMLGCGVGVVQGKAEWNKQAEDNALLQKHMVEDLERIAAKRTASGKRQGIFGGEKGGA